MDEKEGEKKEGEKRGKEGKEERSPLHHIKRRQKRSKGSSRDGVDGGVDINNAGGRGTRRRRARTRARTRRVVRLGVVSEHEGNSSPGRQGLASPCRVASRSSHPNPPSNPKPGQSLHTSIQRI